MKPLRIFILEDEIKFSPRKAILEALKGHDLTIATSKSEALDLYHTKRPYDLLLLDHDMRGFFDNSSYHNTGYQFCVWLVEHELKRPNVILHSQNCVGRSAMAGLLTKNGFQVVERSFSQEYVYMLKDIYGLEA